MAIVEYTDAESNSGDYSLSMTEHGGTPQVFVAYITGLEAGDTVDASAWFLGLDGDGDGGHAGGRLWGHYLMALISPAIQVVLPALAISLLVMADGNPPVTPGPLLKVKPH